MQIKDVLNQFFDGVMKEIEKESKSIGFHLKLDNSNNDGNGQFIPRSHIAQQLEEKLALIMNSNSNSNLKLNLNANASASANSDDSDSQKNSIFKMKQNICHEIIDTFRQLFDKYIDARYAVFMVNVSSHNRDNLIKLFDTHYYKVNYNDNDNHNDNVNSKGIISSGMKLMKRFSKTFVDVNSNSSQIETQRSLINDKLDEKCCQLGGDTNDLIKWLLVIIMEQFEANVREIAFLMNDSFSRFRANESELFQKLSIVTVSQSD